MSKGNCSSIIIAEQRMVKKCRVCDDHALGFNFGGLTCASCKVFFRRNAFQDLPRCPWDGDCIANMNTRTRNACRKCRLNKCLTIGMKKDLVFIKMRDNQEKWSSVKVVLNIDKISSLSNEKTLNLKTHELARLEQIHRAVSAFVDERSLQVGGEVSNFAQLANLTGTNIRQVIKFCKGIDYFRALEPACQMAQLKSFFPEKTIVRIAFMYDLQQDGWFGIENEHDNKSIFVRMDFLKNWPQFRKYIRTLHKEMEMDEAIRDLILVILLLKPEHSQSSQPELVRYHNLVYLYLLRRYLEHKYMDISRAEHKFATLMARLNQIEPSKRELSKFVAKISQNSRLTLSQVLAEIYNLQ